MGTILTIKGKPYDIDKDFTWSELMLVEELGGVPLGREGALESMATIAGLVFVVMKRDEAALTWDEFVKQPIDVTDEGDASAQDAKAGAKRRPTKPVA